MNQLNANTLAINFCKNPLCADFGSLNSDNYLISGESKIACKSCKSIHNLLKPSELETELTQQHQRSCNQLPCCSNKACSNFSLNVHLYPEHYHAFGFSSEKQRYRCKKCQSTMVDRFSISNSHLDIHVSILGLLLTGFSPKEITNKLNIQAKTFSDHLKTMATICRQKSAIFDFHWQNSTDKYSLGSDLGALQPHSHNGVFWIATGDLNSHYIVEHNINLTTIDTAPLSRLETDGRLVEKNIISLHHKFHDVDTSLPILKQLTLIEEKINERADELNILEDSSRIKYPLKSTLVKPHYTATAHYAHIANKINQQPLTLFLTFEPLLGSSALNAFNHLQPKLDIAYLIDDLKWSEGKNASKPEIVKGINSRAHWTLSEQRHIRGPNEQRLLGALMTNNLDLKKAHTMPGITPITTYLTRFYALFRVIVNEPRRQLRPEGLIPLLDIYRAWNNLCHQETPGRTPAVTAGISEKPLSLDQLLG